MTIRLRPNTAILTMLFLHSDLGLT